MLIIYTKSRSSLRYGHIECKNNRRSSQMIARVWRGWTSIENADAYERLLREQVLPSLKQIDGYRGGYILPQEGNVEVEFLVMKLFELLEARPAFSAPENTVPGL